MHIFFGADAYLPRAGGSRVYYHNLYRRLNRDHGHQVTVFTKRVPGWEEFDAREGRSDFNIIREGAPLESWKFHRIQDFITPLAQTLRMLRRIRPDILHAGDLYPQGLIALVARRLLGSRYIAYCHGEEVTQMERQRTEPRLRDLIYRNADRVVCASAFAKATLMATGISEDKIDHITPGVDLERFRPGEPDQTIVQKFSLAGKLVLLTVARLVPRKGHRKVMEAVARLVRTVPNICYLIVGSGSEDLPLRDYARDLAISDSVVFAESVTDADLPNYYRACDVMVMPNFEHTPSGDVEGFGMVFLEASAVGKPVVAGRSGGTAEPVVHGKTGFLVDPDQPEELLRVLRELLTNAALREELGRNGATRARTEFEWSTRALRLSECSERVLSLQSTDLSRKKALSLDAQ